MFWNPLHNIIPAISTNKQNIPLMLRIAMPVSKLKSVVVRSMNYIDY